MQQLGWPAWGMAGSQGPRRLAWRGAAWGVCTFRAISLHPGIRWRHGRWRWNPCITTVLMGGSGPRKPIFGARAKCTFGANTLDTLRGLGVAHMQRAAAGGRRGLLGMVPTQ